MRVVPAAGLVLRDPRTKLLVDPELGVEVDDGDLTFAWLRAHGDVVLLSDADYQAAQTRHDAADKLAVAQALADAGPSAPEPAPAAPPAKASPPATVAKGADA